MGGYQVDILTRIDETFNKMLSENKFLTEVQLNGCYKLFINKFGPEKLKSIDGEVLLHSLFDHGNKESLVYWLEFKNDDELETNRFGGIGGGSALKFGIYKRKEDGKWITGSPKNMQAISINEAIVIAREKRDLLVKGAEIIESLSESASIEDYLNLQQRIDNELHNMGNLGWVHKYYHMLFPRKIDDYHSAEFQSFYLIKMLQTPVKLNGRYALAGQIMNLAKKTKLPVHYFTAVLFEVFGKMHNYWRIGTTDGTNSYWTLMKDGEYVSIGWPNIGNLSYINDLSDKEAKDKIRSVLSEKYPNTPSVIGKSTNQILSFYREIKPNDIVMAAEGQNILSVGKVIGDYEFKEGLAFPHCHSVSWIAGGNGKLPSPGEGLQTTVFQYKDFENLVAIEKLIAGSESMIKVTEHRKKHLDSLTGVIAKIDGILNRKKQIIIYGPPGTGKTYWAEKACLELASRKVFGKTFEDLDSNQKGLINGEGNLKGLVRFCCFHPSYGYEDFIEGIKPNLVNGQTAFTLKDGIFKSLCNEAKMKPEQNFYLIIDEINRGDISRIFGELITIIEIGKRGKEVMLPLSGELFSVPENIYIIGTMNTADRSIALLDVALRRRFGFVELMPDYAMLGGITIETLPLGLWLSELNKRIVANAGRDARNLQIGHSYLLENGVPIKDLEKLKRIIQEDIIPLLEEYCYGDYITISKIIGSSFIDLSIQEINHDLFKESNKSDFVSALLELSPEIATSSSINLSESDDESSSTYNLDSDGEDES